MANAAPQTFKNITPDQYARLSEKAKGAGIEMHGNTGSAGKYGVEVAWNYSPDTQELTLQTLKTPFFMSAADVDSKIRDLVHQTLG